MFENSKSRKHSTTRKPLFEKSKIRKCSKIWTPLSMILKLENLLTLGNHILRNLLRLGNHCAKLLKLSKSSIIRKLLFENSKTQICFKTQEPMFEIYLKLGNFLKSLFKDSETVTRSKSRNQCVKFQISETF